MQGKHIFSSGIMAIILLISSHSHADSWEYRSIEDPMTDNVIYEAVISSENVVDVALNRKSGLSVITRFHPRNGWEVSLTLDSGLITCVQGCYATIRVDNQKPMKHVIEEVFNVKGSVYKVRNDPEKVAEILFNARKILIELPIYKQGDQLFRFETETIDYKRFPHKPGEKEKLINAEKERFSNLYLELIKQNWKRPEHIHPDAFAIVYFDVGLSGEISSLIVQPSKSENGLPDLAYKRSIEEAVMKSSPFPVSENKDVRSALYRFRLKFTE